MILRSRSAFYNRRLFPVASSGSAFFFAVFHCFSATQVEIHFCDMWAEFMAIFGIPVQCKHLVRNGAPYACVRGLGQGHACRRQGLA